MISEYLQFIFKWLHKNTELDKYIDKAKMGQFKLSQIIMWVFAVLFSQLFIMNTFDIWKGWTVFTMNN
jgi:hypothetical protein